MPDQGHLRFRLSVLRILGISTVVCTIGMIVPSAPLIANDRQATVNIQEDEYFTQASVTCRCFCKVGNESIRFDLAWRDCDALCHPEEELMGCECCEEQDCVVEEDGEERQGVIDNCKRTIRIIRRKIRRFEWPAQEP